MFDLYPRSSGIVCFLIQDRGMARTSVVPRQAIACLFLDRIKREKGVWWMPWQ